MLKLRVLKKQNHLDFFSSFDWAWTFFFYFWPLAIFYMGEAPTDGPSEVP